MRSPRGAQTHCIRSPFAGRLGAGFVLFWEKEPLPFPCHGGPPAHLQLRLLDRLPHLLIPLFQPRDLVRDDLPQYELRWSRAMTDSGSSASRRPSIELHQPARGSRQRPSRKLAMGRQLADRTSCRGGKPSRLKTVAARSSGEQASRERATPRSSVAPTTVPPGIPPPARNTDIDRAQWSRPACPLTISERWAEGRAMGRRARPAE
jgi:hypothetical protein